MPALPALALLLLAPAVELPPGPPTRPLPETCAGATARVAPEDLERAWTVAYKATYELIVAGRYEEARPRACEALALSASFPARDWRHAETLDELGLLEHSAGRIEASAAAQAAAVAELLLAKGPEAPEVGVYAARLSIPLEELGQEELAADLRKRPWRVFATAYVRRDEALAARLPWLVSEYLRLENLAAADELYSLTPP